MLPSRMVSTTGSEIGVKLRQFIANTPDGSRISDAAFERRHRGVLLTTALFLPFIFAVSRLTGVESVTGAELPSIPLVHSVAGVGLIAVLLGVAAVPTLPRRVRTSLASTGFGTPTAA